MLRNEENGRDLSDVLQQLLEAWLIQHKQSKISAYVNSYIFVYIHRQKCINVTPNETKWVKGLSPAVLLWTGG